MRKMLLLSDAIDDLKFELRSRYPTIKSAHISEAMARALGLKSNAALIVAKAASKKPKISLADFNGELFTSWLLEKGYKELEPFPYRVFDMVSSMPWFASPTSSGQNAAFYHARHYNIPLVHIVKRRTLADVHWDYISVDESHDPKKFTRDDAMKILALIRKYNGKYGEFGIGVMTGDIFKLKIEDATVVADEIFTILHSLIGDAKMPNHPS